TKAEIGKHDAPLAPDDVVALGIVDAALWQEMVDTSFSLFVHGQQVAARNGLILVDTKYEFGLDADGKLILIDEVHTPASSRYWRMSTYAQLFAAGLEQNILDKEYLRIWYADQPPT